MTKPIKCYVRARSIEDAQSAAHDIDWVVDYPEDAKPFPDRYNSAGSELFEVTISAKPYRPKATRSKRVVVNAVEVRYDEKLSKETEKKVLKIVKHSKRKAKP